MQLDGMYIVAFWTATLLHLVSRLEAGKTYLAMVDKLRARGKVEKDSKSRGQSNVTYHFGQTSCFKWYSLQPCYQSAILAVWLMLQYA